MDPPVITTPKRHKSPWKSLIQKKPIHSRSASREDNQLHNDAANTHLSIVRTPQRTTRSKTYARTNSSSSISSHEPTHHHHRHHHHHERTHSQGKRVMMESFRVEHIFLAEFDIDKGSIVRYRFPQQSFPFDYTEQDIAAQMLPDGSHNTAEDTTYFFLQRNERKWREKQERRRREAIEKYGLSSVVYNNDDNNDSHHHHHDDGDDGDGDMMYLSDDDDEKKAAEEENYNNSDINSVRKNEEKWKKMRTGPDFLYCLNVYKMKQVKGVRRNARVKALTIASTESTIFALQPLLSRALDRIFDVDKSAQMQEAHVEREQQIREREQSLKTDENANENDAIDSQLSVQETPEDIVRQLFEYINSIDLSKYPLLNEYEKLVWRFSLNDPTPVNVKLETTFFTDEQMKQKSLYIDIPLALTENEIQDSRISLVNLVDRLREKTMIVFNAILYEKRIMFLGYNTPAGDVCCSVLSACLLVPMLSKLVRTRAYPYCSLTDLDFLQESGFIAGACNPMFRSKPEWWDCLIDLNTNEIKIDSNQHTSTPVTTTVVDGFESLDPFSASLLPDSQISDDICFLTEDDGVFIQRIIQLIAFHRKKSTSASILEDLVRSHFRDYAQGIVDSALECEQSESSPATPIASQRKRSSNSTGTLAVPSSPAATSLVGTSFDSYFDIVDGDVETELLHQPQPQQPARSGVSTPKTTRLTQSRSRIFAKQSANTAAAAGAGASGNMIKSRRLCKTRHYKRHVHFLEQNVEQLPLARDAHIYDEIRVLRTTGTYNGTIQMQTMPETELISIFQKFNKHVRTYQQFMEFLSYLPHTQGGLYPIAIILMHPSIAVRLLVVAFLRRLSKIKEGSLALEKLNMFLLLAYERNSSLLPDTAT